MKRLTNAHRAGHAQTLPGCVSLLLSFIFMTVLLRVPEVKGALRALDFTYAQLGMLALLVMWTACFFLGMALFVLLSWLYARWPRPK